MRSGRRAPIFLSCTAMLGLIALVGGRAEAQNPPAQQTRPVPLGPDFLNSLGVGSRSIAMGGAFTALADDVTATFWNPARLSTIQATQFMLEGRSVIEDKFRSSGGATTSGFHAGSPQLSFVGLVVPIEHYRRRRNPNADTIETYGRDYYGHIGLSFTLGGYYSLDARQNLTATTVDPTQAVTNTVTDDISTNQRIRNQYLSLTYGNRTSGRVRFGDSKNEKKLGYTLGYGAGVVFLSQDQNFRDITNVNVTTTVGTSTTTNAQSVLTEQTNKGTGTGYILGMSLGFGGVESPLYRLGIAYRSAIKIHYDQPNAQTNNPVGGTIGTITGTGTAFGDEIPSRLAIGLAYESKLARDPVRIAIEEQFFSSANNKLIAFTPAGGMQQVRQQQDLRSSVANFHVGLELEPQRSGLTRIFGRGNSIRFGFYTNEAAAKQYTGYTNVYTLGYALQKRDAKGNIIASVEPTVEIISQNAAVVWTLSGLYHF